jgi:aryl-alcohol dehydrogenase-like predicted oxidoreductase
VSILGFGAEAIGRKGRSPDEAQAKLNAILDGGVTLIDTASAYGSSEAFIGQAISHRHRRGEFTLITKCGWSADWAPAWKPEELEATIDQSLRNLQMDHLDVLLLHSCPLEDLRRGQGIAVLQRAKAQGKARFIGYSGDNEALRYAVDCGHFDVVETSFNMLDQANSDAIQQAKAKGLGVVIKRPLANAVPGATVKPRSDYAAQYWPRWEQIGLTDNDVDHLPWLEVAARFTAFWPGVTAALAGSSHPEHMAQLSEWIGKGPLPSAIATRIRDAFHRVGSSWAGLG